MYGRVTAVAVGAILLCVPVLLNPSPALVSWRHLGALSVLLALGWPVVALALAGLDLAWGQPSWAAPQSPRTGICSMLRAWSCFWLAPVGLGAHALFCTRTRARARARLRLLNTQLGLQLGEEEAG